MPWPTSVRILIVDDEPHMRSLISRILSNSGYAVEEAADAEAALKCWQRQSFHLVVTDWDLPGLNGGQLVERLLEAKTDARFLIVSGQEREIQPGWPFLAKPFGATELARRVGELLE